MKNSRICSLVFFYLLLVLVKSDVIQDSCTKAAQDGSINVDFCVSTLAENPKAKSATSLADLVPISIENVKANATSVISIVSQLLGNKSLEKYARSCLETCSEVYSDAESSLQSAEDAFEKKDYNTVNTVLSAAMTDSDTCEESFKEQEGYTSPLTKENNDFTQLSTISLEFLCMVQKG